MKKIAAMLAVLCSIASFAEETDVIALAEPKIEAAPPLVAAVQAKSRYGPMDVEVRLSDGSVLRGELKGLDSVRLKTAYGTLTFPASRLMRITRGHRLTSEELKAFQTSLKQLDADTFPIRGAAQQKMEEMGPPIVSALKTARATASLEARNRIDTVLKKIDAKGLPRMQMDDIVQADDFSAPGLLDLESFTMKSKFGELCVKFEDVSLLRWLSRGSCVSFDLDCIEGLEDWRDTGVEALPGAALAVQCSGQININGTPGLPAGNPNFGGGNPFITGSVVGRFGANGQPFLIGNAKRVTAETGERLYVKIFWPQVFQRDGNQFSGHYSLKVCTGSWAEDMPVPAPSAQPIPENLEKN